MTNASEPTVKSADRVMQIMELLANRPRRATLSEISQELGIPVSSLHGLLRTMKRRMWLEADETNTRFGIGIQALLVGSSYTRSDELVARAGPMLDWLSETTGETVHYGRLEGSHIVYLAKRESKYQLRIYSAVGRRIPANAAGLGKAILAECSDDVVRELLDWPLPRMTRNTLVEPADLFRDLATVRARGYATEIEESDYGLGCVAIAVPGRGRMSDAISFAVPTARLDPERVRQLADLLLQAQDGTAGHLVFPREGHRDGYLRNLD
jgi:DNA-binding IclR family transcriptional regulator